MLGIASDHPDHTGREKIMSDSTPPRSPEPEDPRVPPASVSDDQPTVPQAQQGQTPAQQYPQATAAQPVGPGGSYPQSAFTYPPDRSDDGTASARKRSWGARLALLIAGAAVLAALLFGGGFWAGSVVNSVPGISDGRFGDQRMGPGGGRPDDGDFPGRGNEHGDSDTDTDGSADTSDFAG